MVRIIVKVLLEGSEVEFGTVYYYIEVSKIVMNEKSKSLPEILDTEWILVWYTL
jgi:hypothetical protein